MLRLLRHPSVWEFLKLHKLHTESWHIDANHPNTLEHTENKSRVLLGAHSELSTYTQHMRGFLMSSLASIFFLLLEKFLTSYVD